MKNQDVIKRYLAIYEKLRQNSYVSSFCNFPRACDFPYNSSWNEAISLTKENMEAIKKSIRKYIPSKISISNQKYRIPLWGSDLVSDVYQITIEWMIHFLYSIYKIGSSRTETKVKSYRHWEECFFSKYAHEENTFYYRGVKNKNYDLVPSIYLDLENDCIMNFLTMEKILRHDMEEFESVYKFKDEPLIVASADPQKAARESNARYEYYFKFLVLKQHASSGTPLLDFTKEMNVAYSVACHYQKNKKNKKNKKTLYKAAVYVIKDSPYLLKVKDGDIDESFFDDFHVEYLNQKISPVTKLYKRYLWNIDGSMLIARFRFYDPSKSYRYCSNDRMSYQKGCFLIPIHAVIVRNRILIDYQKAKIHKFILNKPLQHEIYNDITKLEKNYAYESLLSNYEFLNAKK